ncbi:DUF58 domain-containing protein [Eubacterium oxidoreducens]|uniref:Uncharacterized conserved protein, DUF58 family, contains vWF domain n=1 Tax=Eubacterium oxidoreducens TaxID=1732 RepID=A0A1G6A028_EUBOX|nr:DUF58 domain-containing protein [Eubacterium oxidoreducens]SDB01762.1 Uncharacterized conserved protein, DUF58 family, contains vWF domain [Eubacterium oxidoreducens]
MKKIGKPSAILKKTGYVLLMVGIIVVLAVPAVYINTWYGYFPVIFFGLILLLSWLSLCRVNQKLKIHSGSENAECVRGGLISVNLTMENGSRIFCPKMVAELFVTDLFWNNDFSSKAFFTLPPKANTNMGFDVDMNHIGVYHVGMEELKLYDFLGFFRKKTSLNSEFDVFVKPRIYPLEELYDTEEMTMESDQNERATTINGNDYIGVREYERGDSMKQIHWKLSAHTLGYMTKLYEQSRQKSYTVILDFATIASYNREQLMDINDCLIETSLSIIDEIAKQHTSTALIFTNREKQIQRRGLRDVRAQMLDLIRNFAVITPDPSPDFPDALEMMIEENSQANRSTNVIICTSRVTDELIMQMVQIKRQRRSVELYEIVPAVINSRELAHKRARLSALEEVKIPYHFIRTSEYERAKNNLNEEEPA